jgi:hypothetical protein
MISGFNIIVSTSLHIFKENVKITSLKAENEQMKGKLSKRIEQIEDRYDKFRNMAYP